MIVKKSPCKINLFLDVKSKREDGYHLIESLFHTVNLYDVIEIEESEEFRISTKGKYELNDEKEINIVTKIFNHFRKNMGLKKSYDITIEKNVPTGAGLGGGSSNAACVIKFFLKELKINLDKDLTESFSRFGADTPFFIRGGLSWVSGIGEKIQNYDFTLPYKIILIYPKLSVSTKSAYSILADEDFNKGNFSAVKSVLDDMGNMRNKEIIFDAFYGNLYNVFEKKVFKAQPKIEEYKKEIESIIGRKICMSGSGSSLFALYDKGKNEELKRQEDYGKLKNIVGIDVYSLELI